MDRPTNRKDADAQSQRSRPHEAIVLPSRRTALETCRMLLHPGDSTVSAVGPILLTGDAGVGKTWLCGRLEAESPTNTRWVSVEFSPSNHPADLYRLISHELGLGDPCTSSSGRVELIDFLAERQADGYGLNLVIDEAQNLAMPVWEEIRIMANRLDRPGGFSRMILVGQTSLARRFTTRPFAAIEARLASKIHLGLIDADEAIELANHSSPARTWSVEEVEALHRDSGGNPRRFLRKLGPMAPARPKIAVEPAEALIEKQVVAIEPAPLRVEPKPSSTIPGPLTGPTRPPIRVDENMIEVGWSPEDANLTDDPEKSGGRPLASTTVEAGEEAVLDHYAALQAWREWAENQAQKSPPELIPVEPLSVTQVNLPIGDAEYDDEEIEEDLDELPTSRPDGVRVRAEGEQKFAPFGQLFSRMAQSHDSESDRGGISG